MFVIFPFTSLFADPLSTERELSVIFQLGNFSDSRFQYFDILSNPSLLLPLPFLSFMRSLLSSQPVSNIANYKATKPTNQLYCTGLAWAGARVGGGEKHCPTSFFFMKNISSTELINAARRKEVLTERRLPPRTEGRYISRGEPFILNYENLLSVN